MEVGYRIASFNVKNLSFGGARDLDMIAKIIKDNNLDIVAMQEVLSEGKALTGIVSSNPSLEAKMYERSLISRLGKNWAIRWGDPRTSAKNFPSQSNDNCGEGYAFLWRTDRFELPKNERGKEIEPKIWSNYKLLDGSNQLPLVRNPFYGRFIPKNLRTAEIRLITTHIVFGDASAAILRQNEFEVIAGQIYPRVSEYRKDINCTSPYTIILGDYNMNLPSSTAKGPYVQEVMCFNGRGKVIPQSDNAYCTIYTVQDNLTTLKSGEDGLANNYDHFSYDERVRTSIIKRISVFDIPEALKKDEENSKYDVYRKDVSDHLPIIVDIDFR